MFHVSNIIFKKLRAEGLKKFMLTELKVDLKGKIKKVHNKVYLIDGKDVSSRYAVVILPDSDENVKLKLPKKSKYFDKFKAGDTIEGSFMVKSNYKKELELVPFD